MNDYHIIYPTSQPTTHNELKGFAYYCSLDIEKYCQTNFVGFLCIETLEAYKPSLTSSCSTYLGNTIAGGCNDEAFKLCPDKVDISDIIECLMTHESELSESCIQNLNNRSTSQSGFKIMRQQLKTMTKAISVLSLIYLSFPILILIWTNFMMWKLSKKQRIVIKEKLSILKEEESSPESSYDDISNITSPSSSGLEIPININDLTLEIGFINISYWINSSSNIFSLFNTQKPKQILYDICGEFKSKSLTAIMGPSGSGIISILHLILCE